MARGYRTLGLGDILHVRHNICLVEDIVALTFWSSRYLLSNPLNHHSLSHLEEEKYFFA